jgi:hypothetical protein
MSGRLARIGSLAAGLAALALATPAGADDVGGAVAGQLVVTEQGDLGGAATLELWAPFGPLRLGGLFGVGATPSAGDRYNRTYMTLGAAASLALDVGGGTFVSLVARGGLWGGATQEAKLTVGGLVGGGAYLDVGLGGGVTLGGGLDVWALLGAGDTWAVLPGLRMTWGQPLEAEAARELAETSAGEGT